MQNRAGAWIAIVIAIAVAVWVSSRPNRSAAPSPSANSATHADDVAPRRGDDAGYYVLALSWAPNFCDDPEHNRASSECAPGRHLGFIVHGLWAQNSDGTPAPDCEPSRPLARDTVEQLMAYIPDRGLIAHEWERHLSCHFQPNEVVGAITKAVAAVQIPTSLRDGNGEMRVAPRELEQQFAEINRTETADYRVSCHGGALVSFEACLGNDLRPRECARRAPECGAQTVTLDAR